MASLNEFKRANRRAKDLEARIPRAVTAHYDRKIGRIVVHLSSGLIVSFSPSDMEGLEEPGHLSSKRSRSVHRASAFMFRRWMQISMCRVSWRVF